ncbi:hypothetical protein GF420_16475 [candidate division GN15 bacterium]|nr:hypothetical protein [candidate division GN15 bacterium]
MFDVTPVTFTYKIRPDDTIYEIGLGWDEFATANDAPHLTADRVSGQSLWDHITGREIRHLYQMLVSKARKVGVTLSVPFRCDSPRARRYCRLDIVPATDGSVTFHSIISRVDSRPEIALLDVEQPRCEEAVTVCSWCKVVYSPESGWVEAERAIAEMDLFGGECQPAITHGICPSCFALAEREIERVSAVS